MFGNSSVSITSPHPATITKASYSNGGLYPIKATAVGK